MKDKPTFEQQQFIELVASRRRVGVPCYVTPGDHADAEACAALGFVNLEKGIATLTDAGSNYILDINRVTSGDEVIAMSLAAVKALDGRMFATLTAAEEEVYSFFVARGRRYGVSITVVHEGVDANELARAASPAQAAEILRRSNSRIAVQVANDGQELPHAA